MPVVRRRSPGWVRKMDQPALHSTAFRLQRDRMTPEGLTDNQEWLWDCIISELEYRNRRAMGPDRCWCGLCIPSRWHLRAVSDDV